MKGIIWLASYPRSGNTWLRVVLSHLTEKEWDPEELNSLPIGHAASRELFDDIAGVEASDLTEAQIALLRPCVYQHLVTGLEQPLFLKTHDAWTFNVAGEPVLSATATAGAIYLVRNPLDVAVSFAHFLGTDTEHAIRAMEDPTYVWYEAKTRLTGQLPQRLLPWSAHVRSWLDEAHIPIYVMRYEDMKARPLETFSDAVRFCGLKHTEAEIEMALQVSRLSRLQDLERSKGFREKPVTATRFFREGAVGAWREALSESQVQRLIAVHGKVMRRLGYLDATDDPIRRKRSLRMTWHQKNRAPECPHPKPLRAVAPSPLAGSAPGREREQDDPPVFTDGGACQGMNDYSVYGMHIALAIDLPLPRATSSVSSQPDVVIRFGDVPATLDDPAMSTPILAARPDAFLLSLPGVGRFFVRDGREVCIQPENAVPKDVISLHLLHTVLAALLHQRGQLPLHACGVLVDGGCVAFLGHSSAGKSTLAARLHERGYPVLCDDICAVACTEGVVAVYPGIQRLQLWSDAIQALGLSAEVATPTHPEAARYGFPVDAPLLDQPYPLRRIYVLREARVEPEGFTRLRRVKAFETLLTLTHGQRYMPTLVGKEAHFGRYAGIARSVPVFEWWRPWGLDRLGVTLGHLEKHLKSEPSSKEAKQA
ncbi:MAG: sulfotransferase domain-containing protein [Chloroflexi bacterium]|nr:sulfotransferase domain-containing protein [Chloroflexota bacterium]